MELEIRQHASSLMQQLQAAGAHRRDGQLYMPLRQLAAFLATGLVSVSVQAIDLHREEARISLPEETPRAAGDVFTLVSAVGHLASQAGPQAGQAVLEVDELVPHALSGGGSGSGSGSSVWKARG